MQPMQECLFLSCFLNYVDFFIYFPFTFALIPSIFYWVYFTSWTQVVEHDEATIAENLIYENNWGVPAPLCIAD